MSDSAAKTPFTADELSRGSRFWRRQFARGQYIFTQTDWNKAGWDKAQEFTDRYCRFREIANSCLTYYPCSRECVEAGR
jgi:hypothetical protein